MTRSRDQSPHARVLEARRLRKGPTCAPPAHMRSGPSGTRRPRSAEKSKVLAGRAFLYILTYMYIYICHICVRVEPRVGRTRSALSPARVLLAQRRRVVPRLASRIDERDSSGHQPRRDPRMNSIARSPSAAVKYIRSLRNLQSGMNHRSLCIMEIRGDSKRRADVNPQRYAANFNPRLVIP